MIVCSALLISAAIDSITSDIVSIVRYLPTEHVQLLRDVRDGEDLGDRPQRVDVLLRERARRAATPGSACRRRGRWR